MGLLDLSERAVRERSGPRPLARSRSLDEHEAAGAEGEGAEPPAAVGSALKKLVEFIPTETIALFWLAVPAARSLATSIGLEDPEGPNWVNWVMISALLAITPLLLLLGYLSHLAAEKLPRPPLHEWPWWKAGASAVAFAAWAFAVPGNPFIEDSALLMTAWVVATLVSTVLGLLDPIITQWGRSRG